MNQPARLVWNVSGQTLSYRVPQGAATSATYKVFREYASDDGTPEWSGSATVDPYSQSVTSASGPTQADPQRINVVTTGMVATQKYLLSEAGMSEWVSPIEIEAGYVRVRHPLRNNFTTAATLVSTNLTLTVDATFIADRVKINIMPDPNPGYRVRWSIVVAGVTTIAYTYFFVVRAIVPYQVDISDLNARAPGLIDSLPMDYNNEQGRPLLDAAWQSVNARFASMNLNPDAFRDTSVIDEMVILRALAMLAEGGWKPLSFPTLAEYIALTDAQYNRFCEQHMQAALKSRIAYGTGGEAELVFAEPTWAK